MDDLFKDMVDRLEQRWGGRQAGYQESFQGPLEAYQWSYQWSSNNATGNPVRHVPPYQQQQGQPSSFPGLAGSASHQNHPPTAIFPELPLPLQPPAQQILTPTPNPPSQTHSLPPPTPPLSNKDPITTCLTLHNRPRATHNIPPLQWSDVLHHDAQQYAERLAGRGRMEHSAALGERGQGENLYASSDRKAGMKQAIGAWMGEKRYYPKGAKVGSRGEGGVVYVVANYACGDGEGGRKAVGKDGWVYVVARYWPAGNVVGQQPY
ncbi:hypothetical protein NU195Hw_Modified_190t1 [Hortaea werneckii]